MELVNAIAKARFSSAKAQRVGLCKGPRLRGSMLCLEPGQEAAGEKGQWAYYVVTGAARMVAGGKSMDISTGQLAVSDVDEPHVLSNTGENRLICLAFGQGI